MYPLLSLSGLDVKQGYDSKIKILSMDHHQLRCMENKTNKQKMEADFHVSWDSWLKTVLKSAISVVWREVLLETVLLYLFRMMQVAQLFKSRQTARSAALCAVASEQAYVKVRRQLVSFFRCVDADSGLGHVTPSPPVSSFRVVVIRSELSWMLSPFCHMATLIWSTDGVFNTNQAVHKPF